MKNPLETFKQEDLEVQEAYAGLVNTLVDSKRLDPKTKHLVYIAMKVVADDANAIKFHVPMAKSVGATRDEIKEVILLSLTVVGLKGVTNYLPQALEIYDNS